ncbi:MAG: Bud site selection protein, Revert to axial protein 1 [Chaenotheca gracillima]|nr:MAG: Bud site selection protein, Revert to axial protein 1 [Chaenotheca gracillima]
MALDPHQDQDLDPLTTPTRTIGNPSARKPGDMGPPLHRGPGRQPAAGTGRGITSRGDSGPPQFRNPWGPGGNTFGQGVRRSPTPDERSLIPEVDPLTIPPTYMPMSSSGGRTEPSVGEYPGLPRITEPFKSSIFSRMGPGRTDIPSPVEPYKFHEQLSSSAPGPHSVTPKSQRSTRSMDISTILESVVDAEPEAPSGTNRRDGDDRSEPDKKGSLSGEGLALPAPTQGGSSGRNPYDSWAQASPDLSRNRYLPPKVATSPETDASLPLPQTQARAKDASTNTGSRTMVDASMMTEGSTAADPAILEDDLYGASPKAETHSAGKIDTVGDAEVEEGTTQDSSIALETSTADDAAISDDEMYGASPMAEKDARADATIAKDTVTEETIAEDQSPVLKRSVAHELAILEDDTYGPSPREGSNPAVKGAPLRGEGMRDGTATKASPGEHSSTVMDTVNLEDAGDKQQSDGSRDLDSQEHSDPPKRRGKQAKKAVSRKRKR